MTFEMSVDLGDGVGYPRCELREAKAPTGPICHGGFIHGKARVTEPDCNYVAMMRWSRDGQRNLGLLPVRADSKAEATRKAIEKSGDPDAVVRNVLCWRNGDKPLTFGFGHEDHAWLHEELG